MEPMNTDAERKATEIRLRAERRAGELLRETKKAKGGRPEKNPSHGTTGFEEGQQKPLSDLGISHDQSSRWQKPRPTPVIRIISYVDALIRSRSSFPGLK